MGDLFSNKSRSRFITPFLNLKQLTIVLILYNLIVSFAFIMCLESTRLIARGDDITLTTVPNGTAFRNHENIAAESFVEKRLAVILNTLLFWAASILVRVILLSTSHRL